MKPPDTRAAAAIAQYTNNQTRRMSLFDSSANPLQVVATAVTPVVMVSAVAILTSGLNSRYMAIADRVRSITREIREPDTPPSRRRNLQQQLAIFAVRLRLVSWAVRLLYMALACFVAVALLISVTTWRMSVLALTLPLFLAGLALVVTAIALELLELQEANRTITLELADTAIAAGELEQARRSGL